MNVVVHPASLKAARPVAETTTQTAQRPGWIKRAIIAAVGVVVLGGAGWAGWQYRTTWQFEVATDDAYVQADIVAIAPQVGGYLANVNVGDNERVKAGDLLATIDQRDYRAALDQAKADVAAAAASIAGIQAQLVEQQALIDQADATVQSDQASATYAEQNNKRFGTLADTGYGSVQNAQQAASQIAAATAVVDRDKAALEAARAQVATLNAQLSGACAALEHAQAVKEQADLNLGYTELRAPVDGVVGMRQLRVGLYVQPGTQLLAVVPLERTYVVANYKETQLADVTPGQPVSIDVDTFAGTPVRGTVESIAPASGQEFSLLPPDNATGNFTKIVQRIPVRIAIDRTDPLAGRLLPGMSVTTTINIDPQR